MEQLQQQARCPGAADPHQGSENQGEVKKSNWKIFTFNWNLSFIINYNYSQVHN